MPYVTPQKRAQLDPTLYLLLKALAFHVPVENAAGPLNYVITKLILFTLFAGPTRYHNIALATGILENVKQELYRRLAADYEDGRAEENGDVYAH